MRQEECEKKAEEICNKLISMCKKKEVNNRNIIEIYNELLEPQYKEHYNEILAYIPTKLAEKGYEIVNASYFALKKY